MLKESQDTTSTSGNNDAVDALKSTRKRKPTWTFKEVPSFDGDPNKWLKLTKSTEAIIGKKGHKVMMESLQEET